MENCLPFTDDVMVVIVLKVVQQVHLLALHLETLGFISRLLNALNGLYLKKIVGSNNFSAQFIKIISHYKKIGYNKNVL